MIEPENVARWHREVAAIGNAAAEDPEAFAQAEAVLYDLRNRLIYAVHKLRAGGYSDSDIGRALGVTRQAVQQRFPRART